LPGERARASPVLTTVPNPGQPDSDRWHEVDALLEQAMDHAPEDRERFLREVCGDDTELHEAVLSLVRASERSPADVDRPGGALLRAALTETGEVLGAYRLLEPLGSGGMGTVYLAERADGQFEQRVAVKVVKRAAGGSDLDKRFLRERQILARLQHANIARLYDGGLTSDGRPYFVMELVEGTPITGYCQREAVDVEGRLELMEAVGRAVHYAHGLGVIHRDLKPANILVTDDGAVKLLDFGIAKLGGDDSGETLTRTGVQVLTPAYASPEQLRGHPVTTASDVYQLGLVLYELLAGRLPIGEAPTAPGQVAGSKRVTDLDRVCLTALSSDPARRYPSADAFVADLRRYREDRPVAARPDTPLYRLSKFVERHRGSVAAAAVLIAAAAIGGYFLGQGAGAAGQGEGGPMGAVLPVVLVVVATVLVASVIRARPRPPTPVPWARPAVPAPAVEEPHTPRPDERSRATGTTETALDPHTVAVLPFGTLGSDDTDAFSAGLHEDLLTELSRVSALTVISRTSAAAYKGSGKSITEIGRELGAGTVIEGTVQRAGGRVRLNVQVIDARRDVHRWAERYDRELTAANVFDLQSELVAKITDAIRAELTPREEARLSHRPTDDLEAYRLYLEGRAQLVQRTHEGMRHALDSFRAAVDRDPDYAPAWAGLSEAVALLEWYHYPVPDDAPDAEDVALQAIRLDPELAEAHMSLGIARSIRRDGPAMLQELERAVELQPSHAEALIWLAWFYLLVGRPSDALEPTERATALNPLAPAVRVFRAEALLANGQPERALEEASRAREIQPDYALAHFMEGLVLHHLHRHEEAESAFRITAGLALPLGSPRQAEVQAALALTRIAAGDRAGAEERLAQVEEEAPGDPFWTGLVHAALGDEEAFAAFARIERWGWFETEAVRYFFPDELGSIRDDPRYGRLLRDADRSWGCG
jgi:TolB-like protein/Flp pilus assembly protein TadD